MGRKEKLTVIPEHLSHKPIYVMEGYSSTDGCYKNDTDVIGVSVGKAQWAEGDFVPRVKIWRDVKNKKDGSYRISPQNEETTVTRALDMALLVIKVLDTNINDVEIKGINSVHGQVTIKPAKGYYELDASLRQWIQDNKHDLLAQVRGLKDAIEDFYRHMK